MVEDIQIRVRLKDKKTGKLSSTYPPLFAENNGLNKWPIDDHWEILGVERNSGIKIEDIHERKWEAYEGDKITLLPFTSRSKKYTIQYQDGMFGIVAEGEGLTEDFVYTLGSDVFSDSKIREYHYQQFMLKHAMKEELKIFIPLAHLNIKGTIEGSPVLIITHE